MYSSPAKVKVRGDGVLLSTNLTSPVERSATPFNRSLPAQQTELMWANLTAALWQIESADVSGIQTLGGAIEITWLEYTLLDRIVNATGIRAMEDSLSYIAALSYALIAQDWRTKSAQGGSVAVNLSQTWIPQNVTLSGAQYRLFTRLRISGPQLIITFISTIVLVIVSLAKTFGHADQNNDPVIHNGGVIDLLSMLAGSALPAILSATVDDSAEGRDSRRARAEKTMVG